jgi:hypothetical protein
MLALSSPHAVTATPHLLSLRDLSFFLSFFFNPLVSGCLLMGTELQMI